MSDGTPTYEWEWKFTKPVLIKERMDKFHGSVTLIKEAYSLKREEQIIVYIQYFMWFSVLTSLNHLKIQIIFISVEKPTRNLP